MVGHTWNKQYFETRKCSGKEPIAFPAHVIGFILDFHNYVLMYLVLQSQLFAIDFFVVAISFGSHYMLCIVFLSKTPAELGNLQKELSSGDIAKLFL